MKELKELSKLPKSKTDTKLIKGRCTGLHRLQTSRQLWLKFLVLLKSIQVILTQNYLIQVVQHGKSPAAYDCSNAQNLVFHSIRLQKDPSNNNPISFNLIDYEAVGAPATPTFITNPDTGNKMYGMYELGSKCYMHDQAQASLTYPFFTLVLTKSDTTSNCKVTRIITNVGLVPCSGTTSDLFSAITLVDGLATTADFRKIQSESTFASKYHKQLGVSIADLALGAINDKILEMMLVVPFHWVPSSKPISTIFWKSKAWYNGNIQRNPDLKHLRYTNVIQRITRDDLPGYYLGVYGGEGDDYHKYHQSYFKVSNEAPIGIHLNFYLASPQTLAVGQEHKVDILSKMAIQYNRPAVLKQFHYEVRFLRTATHINFKVYRDGTTVSNTLSLSYTGSTDYVYFGFTAAAGILYFKDASNVKAKVYETLTVYQSGTKLDDVKSYIQDAAAEQIVRSGTALNSEARLFRVEYKPAAGVTSNDIGLRVYQAIRTNGAYPQFLISSRTSTSSKCFYIGYKENECFSMAMLDGPNEASTDQLIDSSTVKTATSALMSMCRVPYTTNKCMIPKSGHIGNLGVDIRVPLYYSVATIDDYNALSTRHKNFFVEATNNVGTKYLLACPHHCNFFIFVIFSYFFRWNLRFGDGLCTSSGCNGIDKCKLFFSKILLIFCFSL